MKELFDRFVMLFTRISTLIFIFSGIYIGIFWGNGTILKVDYVFGVLGLAFVSALLQLPLEMMETLSSRTALILQTVYFVTVNACVLATGFFLEWFDMSNRKSIVGFEITIFAVCAGVIALNHFIDKKTADKMNERLSQFKDDE